MSVRPYIGFGISAVAGRDVVASTEMAVLCPTDCPADTALACPKDFMLACPKERELPPNCDFDF